MTPALLNPAPPRLRPARAIAGLLVLLALGGCKPKGFRTTTSAMAPTIAMGELIVADMAAYARTAPERWDVIVFASPGKGRRPASGS